MRRLGVLALLVGANTPAVADDNLEASGFTGVAYFGDHIQLGNSWAPEQIPGTAPVLGGRLTYVALPDVWTTDAFTMQLAVETEVAFDAAFTGGVVSGRMSYFAPVFAYRAQGMLRLANLRYVQPHLVIGGGGETVSSSSPFMARDTDGEVYWGLGARVPLTDRLSLRLDGRHGIMPARGGGATSTFELQLGIGGTFGLAQARSKPHAEAVGTLDDVDTDHDGIPDRLDKCPTEPETVNGVADDDGCPEADPDGDGIVGDADKCPDQAEDFDHFQDEDGCPDLDNDHDGIPDKQDACPNEPETVNFYQDDDGCPDVIPPDLAMQLANISTMKFEPGRARVTDAAQKIAASLLDAMNRSPAIRVALTGHPDKETDAANDLAKRRVEALKWYLVDQGVAQDRIDTAVGAASKGAPVEATLAKP